ncbi:hypothetical protein FQN54_009220 [Arachnomyces sp. PD_36]|nr:hypothetical protein FQN54_009220 [Arachnomyces sp. PD_36]
MKISYLLPATLILGSALANPVPQPAPAPELEERGAAEFCEVIQTIFTETVHKFTEAMIVGALDLAAQLEQQIDGARYEWDEECTQYGALAGAISGGAS